EDNPSEALRQYESVRRLLREELGLAPADATRAVVADLLGRPLDSLGRGRRTTTQRLAAS
ncbi:MAG: Bacterial transcriptional activator domain, partial [Pseudonocardiales bacterium]|nr:Bacterial transcriptional activator domain [Pseudonocardiales bacterium]